MALEADCLAHPIIAFSLRDVSIRKPLSDLKLKCVKTIAI